MKVVLKPVMFEKIKKAVKEHGDSIIRIELTCKEFSKLVKECTDGLYSESEFSATDLRRYDETSPLRGDYAYSGCYVVYKGVCIQTHESYTE